MKTFIKPELTVITVQHDVLTTSSMPIYEEGMTGPVKACDRFFDDGIWNEY